MTAPALRRPPRWPAADLVRRAAGTALCLGLAACGTRPPAPDALVTGVAVTRERVVLPPSAVFAASLLDVTNPDVPPVVLGSQQQEPAGQPPFAIRIPYSSLRFLPKGRYEVRANVTLEGRLLLTTQARHPVPSDAAFRRVDVQLHRQGTGAAIVDAGAPLLLTYWRLVEIEGTAIARPPEGSVSMHLVFQADEARATGWGGCNRFLADHVMSGSALQFTRVVSNITLCLDSGRREAQFLAALAAVASYRQQGLELVLRGANGDPLLRFEATQTTLE